MTKEKPANEDLSQQSSSVFNTSEMETIYESAMDSMLALAGRSITVWLEPGQTQSTTNPSQFNPWTGSRDPRLGPASEGNSGRAVEPIFVTYTAQVVHGPRPISEDRPFELEVGEVQLTTVIGSLQDMHDAIEVEVDGIKFDKKQVDDRQIGFQTPKYLITVWSRKAEANG